MQSNGSVNRSLLDVTNSYGNALRDYLIQLLFIKVLFGLMELYMDMIDIITFQIPTDVIYLSVDWE